MRTTMLAALAALLPCAAWAAPAPLAANGIPVDPGRSVAGHFDAAGAQGWRVYLRQGRDYALSGLSSDGATVTIERAGGQTIARFDANTDDPGGASFRAPYTGLYSVQVSCGEAGDPCVTPSSYTLTAGRDCPGTVATPCAIAVGQTLRGMWISYDSDVDAFRTRLAGGVSYAIGLPVHPGGGTTHVAVLDARGRQLAVSDALFRFTAPASGTYYLAVSGGDGAVGAYALSLSR